MLQPFMTPSAGARLLLRAARNVRALGDVPGHEFHGNQWTSGMGGSAIVYHGTSRTRLDSILKEGVKADRAGTNYGQSTKQNVYLSTTEKDARFWGGHTAIREHKAGSGDIEDFVTLRIELPHTEIGKLKADRQAKGDALKFRGDIKPEWIKEHTVHSSMLGKPPRNLSRHPESAIHAAADRHIAPLSVAVRYAFARGRKAYRSGGLDAAVAAVRKALLDVLPGTLAKALAAGGAAAVLLLEGQLRAAGDDHFRAAKPVIKMTFDVANKAATKWAREHAAELAKGISETTREDIKAAVARAQEEGDLGEQYDDILAAVGDETRADLIARTEAMTAANEGQRQAWDQAVDDGLLTGDEFVEWITTSDACPECEALDGAVRPLDGEYPDDGGDGPPLHPNCRCTEGISAMRGAQYNPDEDRDATGKWTGGGGSSSSSSSAPAAPPPVPVSQARIREGLSKAPEGASLVIGTNTYSMVGGAWSTPSGPLTSAQMVAPMNQLVQNGFGPGVELTPEQQAAIAAQLAQAAKKHASNLPLYTFMLGAGADWATTAYNLGDGPNQSHEADPLYNWVKNPKAMVATGIGIDAAATWLWMNRTKDHKKIQSIGLYVAAAARGYFAIHNYKIDVASGRLRIPRLPGGAPPAPLPELPPGVARD